MTKLYKHQFVTYRAWEGVGPKVNAIVRCVHKDGTATVEAQCILYKDGTAGKNFHRTYRIDQSRLTPGAV